MEKTTNTPFEREKEMVRGYLTEQEIESLILEDNSTSHVLSVNRKGQEEKYDACLENFYGNQTPFNTTPTRGTVSRLFREIKKGETTKIHRFNVPTNDENNELGVEFLDSDYSVNCR